MRRIAPTILVILVLLLLGCNRTEQLVRLQTDMNPFHFLKLPFLNIEVDWGK